MVGAEQSAYPIRDSLVELTFEAKDEGLDPFDAYVRFREKLGGLGLHAEDYCSSSITSGGHARDASLEMGDVIRKNTDSAMALCDELFAVGQLNPGTAVEAVVLGKVPWKQSDYMTFWLATMAGLQARGNGVYKATQDFRKELAGVIENSDVLDMATYDSKDTPEVRAPHYFEHARLFAATAQHHISHPVRRLVRLIDANMSLGAQTENIFARLMGTGVFGVAIAQAGIAPTDEAMPERLYRDTETLVSFGATVFETDPKKQLVLVQQEI